MRIGLVGEAPNDTDALENLLKNKFRSPEFEYCSLLDRINGSLLDNQKTKRFLRIEYEDKKPDIVIFIRDLDSLLPNPTKLKERKFYFSSSNSVVDKKGIFLLNIFEIEALILADIETFNGLYETAIETVSDPMAIPEPKEFLKEFSNKYCESDNPDVFFQLDFDKMSNCKYFTIFITKFEKAISSLENR